MRKFLAIAALAAGIASVPAAAQWSSPYRPLERDRLTEIEWRLDRIYEHVEQARRSGRISPGQARDFHEAGREIAQRYNDFRYDGITRDEARSLSERTRDLRDHIRNEERDGWDRDDRRYPWPYDPRDPRGGRDGWGRDDGWSDDRRWSDNWDGREWDRDEDRRWDDGRYEDDPRRRDGWEDPRDGGWRDEEWRSDDWNVRSPESNWRTEDRPRDGDEYRDAPDGVAPEYNQRWQETIEPERVERIDPFDPGSAADPADDRWFYGDAPNRDEP